MLKPLIFLLLLSLTACSVSNPEKDKKAIYDSMYFSQKAWNNGDLEGFMSNYWQSDSMKFIGKTSITYGYQPTLDRYKKGYPDADSRGQLLYDFIHLDQIDGNHYFQVGKYTLIRKTDTLSGHFSLLWERIDGEWRIVADHSS